jgi:hypothetical protein
MLIFYAFVLYMLYADTAHEHLQKCPFCVSEGKCRRKKISNYNIIIIFLQIEEAEVGVNGGKCHSKVNGTHIEMMRRYNDLM